MSLSLMFQQLLEARGEGERESAKRREVERVGRVEQARAGDAARVGLAGARFRIVARVVGERLQVTADDARGPITADAVDGADVVRDAGLADLREARLLHAVVVRP